MKRAGQLLEAAFIESVAALAGALSYPRALALGRWLGRMGFATGLRRRVVLENLRHAFPEWDEARVRATAVASYEIWGQAIIDHVRTARLAGDGWWSEVLERLDGLENIEAAQAAGRGVLLLTGHFGLFDLLGGAIVAAGFPTHVVVQPQSNPWVDRRLERHRKSLGLGVIRRGAELRDVLRALRANQCVGLLADQDAGGRGEFVEFFGRPASTPVGPAVLSLRTGAPILMTFLLRGPDGRHRGTVLPPLDFVPSGDFDADVHALTQQHARVLEEWVRRHPEHWYWLHRRWKTPASPMGSGPECARATGAAMAIVLAATLCAGATEGAAPKGMAPRVAAQADSAPPTAEPTTFGGAGASLLPLAETRVGRMVEDIVARRSEDSWTVDVVDVFQSGAAPEVVPIALPDFESAADSAHSGPTISGLRLFADGVEMKPTLEPPPAKSDFPGLGGLSGLYTWRLRFASEEQKVVRLSFRVHSSRTERGDELLFHYLNTGTPWRGASGRVNARFELGDLSSEDLVADWLRPTRYGVGASSVTWQLASEEPEEDLVVALRRFGDPLGEFADREKGPLALERLRWEEWLSARTPHELRFWLAFLRARRGETPADTTFRARITSEPWFRARAADKLRKPSKLEVALASALERRISEWETHRVPETALPAGP